MADKQNTHYISAKESRDIARSNRREIRRLQKLRKTYRRADCVTQMKDPRNVVEFDDLHTYFFTDNGVVKAVNGVSFDIPQGATVGVVGESGCGKSVTSLSLMQLVQAPMGQVVSGSIRRQALSLPCVPGWVRTANPSSTRRDSLSWSPSWTRTGIRS